MASIGVKDLKRPRELRDTLEREREVIVTKDGQPFAVMIGVDPECADDVLSEVRRALFSAAVVRARRRALSEPFTESEVAAEVATVRAQRSR